MTRCEELATEILQEFTNCYSEQDEELLTGMIEQEIEIAKQDVAREIFEEIDKTCHDYNRYEIGERGLFANLAELKKKYIGE